MKFRCTCREILEVDVSEKAVTCPSCHRRYCLATGSKGKPVLRSLKNSDGKAAAHVKVEQEDSCPKCGAQVPAGVVVCVSCGADLPTRQRADTDPGQRDVFKCSTGGARVFGSAVSEGVYDAGAAGPSKESIRCPLCQGVYPKARTGETEPGRVDASPRGVRDLFAWLVLALAVPLVVGIWWRPLGFLSVWPKIGLTVGVVVVDLAVLGIVLPGREDRKTRERNARDVWMKQTYAAGPEYARDEWCTIIANVGSQAQAAAAQTSSEKMAERLWPAVELLYLRRSPEFANMVEACSTEGRSLAGATVEIELAIMRIGGKVDLSLAALEAKGEVALKHSTPEILWALTQAQEQLLSVLNVFGTLVALYGTKESVAWLLERAAGRLTLYNLMTKMKFRNVLQGVGDIGPPALAFDGTAPDAVREWFVGRLVGLALDARSHFLPAGVERSRPAFAEALLVAAKEMPDPQRFLLKYKADLLTLANHEDLKARVVGKKLVEIMRGSAHPGSLSA